VSFTICLGCARFRQGERPSDVVAAGLVGPSCEAFPEGIPDDVIRGGFDHRRRHAGDGGVRFEQRPGWEFMTEDYDRRLAENPADDRPPEPAPPAAEPAEPDDPRRARTTWQPGQVRRT
jgi:hypothetical protein